MKILVIGPPGSRKTTLILQFPGLHVEDCDNNLDGPERIIRFGLKDPSGKVIVEPMNPNLSYTYDSIRKDDNGKEVDVEDCYNRLCDKLKLFKTDPAYKDRKAVFVDSLSHVNEFIIRHVLKMQGKTRKTYEMEARDWSPFKSFAYILLVARLEETGKTIICSCHENKLYGPPAQENMMNPPVIGYEPMFQGKLGETLGAFFTDVWRMETRNAPGGKIESWLIADRIPKCDVLKNSVGMPPEINVTKGFSAIEPYLKGRI